MWTPPPAQRKQGVDSAARCQRILCVFSTFFQDGCYPSFLRSHKEKSQHLFIGKYSSCEGTFSLPPSCLTECLKCKMCQACVSLCTLMGLVRDY